LILFICFFTFEILLYFYRKYNYPFLLFIMGCVVCVIQIWYRMKNVEPTYEELLIENESLKKLLSEKTRIEIVLKESEEKYRFVFDQMTYGFQLNEVVYDKNNNPVDFRILAANRYFNDFFGLDYRKVIGKTIREILPTVDDEMVRKYNSVGINGEPLQFEYFSKAFNKYIKFLAYSTQKNQFVCLYEDITAQKTAEKVLTELNEKINALSLEQNIILENSPIGISKNIDRSLVWVNEEMEKIFGYSKAELTGRSARFLYPSDEEYDKFGNKAYPEISKGITYITEQELVCKNGEHKTIRYIGKAVDKQDMSKGSIWIVEDITTQKKAEVALKESEEKFRHLIEKMQIGILLQGPNAEILLSNSKALELLGLTESQLLGKTSFDSDWNVIHEDGTPFPGKTHPVPQAIATRSVVHDVVMGVYRPLHSDRIWLLVDAEPQLDDKGEVQQVICVFIDITLRKQAELVIYDQNLQLKEHNTQKDKFFSIIAHDLRDPISVFLGITDQMVNKFDSMSLKDIQKFTEVMRTSATNLYRLLENLLDWSRIEKGLMPFQPTNGSLLPVLNETISLSWGLAIYKGVALTYIIDENLEVFADLNMLKTIVRNLLSNAIKFSSKGDKIIISADKSGNKCINICVKDTGIGMNKNMVESLFQLDRTTGRDGTQGELGTGLGLILCKNFIEINGGRIWVESEEGKGSSFYFTLPVIDEDTLKQ
jgi:two-component system, sensor histidine kinase and response regulator